MKEEENQAGAAWTFDLVEERLIEAAACWRREADASAGWHHVKAFWPDVRQEYDWWFDYRSEGAEGQALPPPVRDVRVPRLPLSRAERARMIEASAWIGAHVPERDRRLVSIVLVIKAGGQRPDWARVMAAIGVSMGRDGVRMRYERAVRAVVRALVKARVAVAVAAI